MIIRHIFGQPDLVKLAFDFLRIIMSLTSFLEIPDVRAKFQMEFQKPKFAIKRELLLEFRLKAIRENANQKKLEVKNILKSALKHPDL